MNKRNKKGFTLIELLVVISIMAILTTIVVVGYNGAQARSRDAKRKADVESIATAYTLYHQETKSWQLPAGKDGDGYGYFNFQYSGTSLANYFVSKGYLPQEVKDPKLPVDATTGKALDNAPQYFVYKCFNNTTKTLPYTGVVIYAFLENPTAKETSDYTQIHDNAKQYCEDDPDSYTKAEGGESMLANYAVMVK